MSHACGRFLARSLRYFSETFGATPVQIALLMACVSSVGLGLVYLVGKLTSVFELRRGLMCLLCLISVDVLNFATTVDSLLFGCVSWTVREGMLNGMLELKKSIMMDYTPKGSRKRTRDAVERFLEGRLLAQAGSCHCI